LKKTVHILAYHVKFQVHGGTWQDILNIRVFEGIRDDGYRKLIGAYIENSKTDAVEADGAFFNNQGGKLIGKAKAELPAAIQFFSLGTGGGGIYMALNNMAIEPAIHDHTAFQVYEVAFLPVPDIAFLERFGNGGNPVAVVLQGFYREAHAVMGNTLVYFQFVGEGRRDPEGFISA